MALCGGTSREGTVTARQERRSGSRRWINILAAFPLVCFALVASIAPQRALAAPASSAVSRAGLTGGETVPTTPSGGMKKAPYQAKCRLPSARIQFAAPAVGDLDHDAYQEIVVGTSDGWVYALKANQPACTILWSFNTSAALNTLAKTPSPTTIRQAPTIVDLDGDNWNEVLVPVGSVAEDQQNGGVIVLTHDGQLRRGWPQLAFDAYDRGYTEGVVTSPTAADLDGDGDLEIIAGGLDHRVYAWHDDGTWLEGWPRHVFDTVWASPVVADLDRDGLLEVIAGVDSHDNPYYHSINGGALYVFRHDGTPFGNFPKYTQENFESTPALVDLDGDGYLDIVIGGGSVYKPGSAGYRVHAFNRHGNELPGWPVAVGGHVTGSPAIADLDGDGRPEVVVGSWDGRFYAWRGDGTLVSGWPVRPRDWQGTNYPQQSAVIANLDGASNTDGKPEIFLHSGWEVIVLDARGNQLTWDGASGNPQNKPTYWADWTLDATQTIADVDADGKLELVAGGGESTTPQGGNATVYIWELPNSKASDGQKDWPTFKHASDRASLLASTPKNAAAVVRHTVPDQMIPGQAVQVQIVLRNTGTDPWAASSHFLAGSSIGCAIPSRVELAPGVSIGPGKEAAFSFTIVAPSTPGHYALSWRMTQQGPSPFGQAISVQVKVGNEPAYYVLRGSPSASGGGIYAGGLAKPISPPAVSELYWERARNFELTLERTGYFLLDGTGYIMWAGAAPDIGSIAAENPAVELVLGPDRQGYYVINAKGKLWWGGGYVPIDPLPPTFADERVRSFAVTADYRGVHVLDKNGRVYTGGTAKPLSPATPVFADDIALKIKLTKDGKGYYVLDRYGRVYSGGAAPVLAADYAAHLGEDWARDFELTEDERGYYLLDKFGGIHAGGAAVLPTMNSIPAWEDGSAADLQLGESQTANLLVVAPVTLSAMTTRDRQVRLRVRLNVTLNATTVRVTANQPWLKVDAQSVAAPGDLSMTIDPRALALGTHQATITISGDDVANSPLAIPVQLRVVNKLLKVYLPLAVQSHP